MMKLKNVFLFIILIGFFSCEKTGNNTNFNTINSIHNKVKSGFTDSTFTLLNQSENLINKQLPDSLEAENNFLLGNYYTSIKNNDSAYHYYNKDILFSKNKIQSKREINYYKKAAYQYKKTVITSTV